MNIKANQQIVSECLNGCLQALSGNTALSSAGSIQSTLLAEFSLDQLDDFWDCVTDWASNKTVEGWVSTTNKNYLIDSHENKLIDCIQKGEVPLALELAALDDDKTLYMKPCLAFATTALSEEGVLTQTKTSHFIVFEQYETSTETDTGVLITTEYLTTSGTKMAYKTYWDTNKYDSQPELSPIVKRFTGFIRNSPSGKKSKGVKK